MPPTNLLRSLTCVLALLVVAGCVSTAPVREYSPVRPLELGPLPDVVILLEEADEGGEPIGGLRGLQREVVYPEEAKRNRIVGVVQVHFVASARGEVLRAEVVQSAHPLLDREALHVVAHHRFEPAKKDGIAVAFESVMPITFKMR
jgi:TonB family protein